jgi:hypothetical protein
MRKLAVLAFLAAAVAALAASSAAAKPPGTNGLLSFTRFEPALRSGCHEPVWSPDGKKIAFTMFVAQTGQSDLYTVSPDGTGLYQVTHSGLGAGLKDWGTHPLTH